MSDSNGIRRKKKRLLYLFLPLLQQDATIVSTVGGVTQAVKESLFVSLLVIHSRETRNREQFSSPSCHLNAESHDNGYRMGKVESTFPLLSCKKSLQRCILPRPLGQSLLFD